MSIFDDIRRDAEAGTPEPWEIEWRNIYADADDVKYDAAHKEPKGYKVGDVMSSWPVGLTPVRADHDHWLGYYVQMSDEDARRIARVPQLEAIALAAEELADAIEAFFSDDDGSWIDGVDPGPAALAAFREASK